MRNKHKILVGKLNCCFLLVGKPEWKCGVDGRRILDCFSRDKWGEVRGRELDSTDSE
jgi:hypothetical protein